MMDPQKALKDTAGMADSNGAGHYEKIADEPAPEKGEPPKKSLKERLLEGEFWTEFKSTMSIAWALVLTQMCQLYFQPIATMFGGHLGKLELGAIALSNTIINVMGTSIVIGFSTALDTVLSQSFGRGNYEMVGIYFQRGLILTILILLPCLAIQINITPILIGLGQDEAVSRLVGQYLTTFIPGLFCLFMWIVIRKFTQCQNAVVPHIIIILVGHAVHALLQYILIFQVHLGITGSALAQSITYFFCMVVTIVYTMRSEAYKQSWGGFDKRAWEGLGELALLGVLGMLMLCLEWWAFEVSVIVSGILGTTQLAVQSVAFNLNLLDFGIPSGLAVATSIRVGQLLGAGQPRRGKTAAKVGACITVTNALIWLILYCSLRFEIPKIFTDDPQLIKMVAAIIPLVGGFTFADAITTVGKGVLRGGGKQLWGMITVFVGYYCLALPTAIPLTFLTPLGVGGLWVGFIIASYATSLAYIALYIWKLDWEAMAKEAIQRAAGRTFGQDEKPSIKQEEEEGLIESSKGKTKGDSSKWIARIVVFLFFGLILLTGILTRCLLQDSHYNTGYYISGNVTNVLSKRIFNDTIIANTTV